MEDDQLLIKNLKEPVVILDVDQGHFIDCNDQALDFFNLTKNEILSKNPFDLSPPNIYGHEAEAYSRQVIQEALAGANPVFDWIHIDKEGNEIPCEIRLIRFPPFNKQLVRGTIIDKRKTSEKELFLRESEERLRLALAATDIGTFDYYPKEERVLWDEQLLKILGIAPNSSINLNAHFFSILHPDDKERIGEEFEKSFTKHGRDSHHIEYRVIVNDRTKHILAHSRMIRDENGEVTRMLGTSQDITELRESEEKLRRNEKLFKSIVQDQEEMIVRWKPGGIRTFANRSYIEKFDLKESEVVGSSFFDLINDEDKKAVIEKLESLSPENPTAIKIHRVNLPDGSTGWQEWTDRVLYDEAGNELEYQSTGRDITEIMEARKKLEESERRYRNVFNQQFQFTALLDLDGRVIHVNDLPLRVHGREREDYIGKYFWESPALEGNSEWVAKIKNQVLFVKNTEEPLIVEDPFYDASKETRWATTSYSVLKNGDGTAENILVQAIDITTEKQAKQEIVESERRLSLIYENTNDFILLIRCDKQGYFLEEINDACLQLLDLFSLKIPKEKLIGISMREVYENLIKYPKEKVDERIKAFDYIKNKGEQVSYQQEIKTEKGLLVTTVDVVPVIQEAKVTHLLMVAKDITESYLGQKKLEEAYQQVSELKAQLEQENIYLKEEIKQANDFESMVFKSKEFRNILNKVEQVAKTDATVLITGETGTGKELIARAIHNVSKRSEKPMIKVNTAAIPKDLIESELFGHEKGAFTGAVGEKPGKFELADGGTIFLDEIGDMPIDLQVKILRVLQEGEVERLGSTKVKKINVRFISATNKNLEDAIKEGKFREDLYFRLKVFPIEIPPLRSRPDDVPILVEHFTAKYGVKHSKPIKIIPKSAMDYLRNYSWPGNVRELENTIERAIILTMGNTLNLPEVTESAVNQEQWEHDNALDVIQENHIRKVLEECHWKIEGKHGAAAQLKIKPSTLRDKMNKFSIKRPSR